MSDRYLNSERAGELWEAVKAYVDARPGGAGLVNVPVGTIVIWSGTADDIPEGWQMCDGTNGTPDLRDRFVLGSGAVHPVGETGGEEEVTLTVEQMPKHDHDVSVTRPGARRITTGTTGGAANPVYEQNITTSSGGSSQPHNNMPPYMVVTYCIKAKETASSGSSSAYRFGHGLKQDGNEISVDTVDDFTGDNTLPMTAAGVETVVGNIEILLETI